MTKIVFKNKETLQIPDEALQAVYDKVTSGTGAKNWQGFTSAETNKAILLFDLSEVLYIYTDQSFK